MGSEHSDGATQVAHPRYTKACRRQAEKHTLAGNIRRVDAVGRGKERGDHAHAGSGMR